MSESVSNTWHQQLNIPRRFEVPYLNSRYGAEREDIHPQYRTTNTDYGWHVPPPLDPQRYFPLKQSFTSQLSKSGMYRNYSLNTQLDGTYIQ
ncbi:hypothetical protein DMENIID0001_053310 [Sergentomyia squamirostris]